MASVVLILGIIGVDQCVKIWVKTHMALHDVIDITGWFKIAFVENNGMAFGMELVDKIFLTSFRIVAVVWIVWYMARVIRRGTGWAYVVCLSMILAGAAGNIIDCMFYGMIFNNPSSPLVAEFVSLRVAVLRACSGYALFPAGRMALAGLDACVRR